MGDVHYDNEMRLRELQSAINSLIDKVYEVVRFRSSRTFRAHVAAQSALERMSRQLKARSGEIGNVLANDSGRLAVLLCEVNPLECEQVPVLRLENMAGFSEQSF